MLSSKTGSRRCYRRFCRRYKETIVRKAKRFQHESRNESDGVAAICAVVR
jgi:hypothetical protein